MKLIHVFSSSTLAQLIDAAREHGRISALLSSVRTKPNRRRNSTQLPKPKIMVDEKRKRVQVDARNVIDMRRKGTTWRLILALVQQRIDAPGEPISQPDLFELVWPGEQFGPTTSSRMYTAIHRVREKVLGEILVTEEDGYFLNPDCEIAYNSPADLNVVANG